MVKIELQGGSRSPRVIFDTLLTLVRQYRLFQWDANQFGIGPEVMGWRIDSRMALAGLFGEAIALLFMSQRGFIYWDRTSTLWRLSLGIAGTSRTEQTRLARSLAATLKTTTRKLPILPDFVCEMSNGQIAAVEAKASFDDKPKVKRDLKKGLRQLASWRKYFIFSGSDFVVGTYLSRIPRGPGLDPSFIAWTDPDDPPPADRDAVKLPPGLIRRSAVAAWLEGMRLQGAADALRSLKGEQEGPVQFPVLKIHERHYALSRVETDVEVYSDEPESWVLVMGIDVDLLRLVEMMARNPRKDVLGQFPGGPKVREEESHRDFIGSLLTDGTLLGLARRSALERQGALQQFFVPAA